MDKNDLTIFKEIKKEVDKNRFFYQEIYEKCGSYPAHMAVYSQISYSSAMLRSLFEILNDETPVSDKYDDLNYLRRDAKAYDRQAKEIYDLYFHDGNLLEKKVKERILLIAKRSILRQWIKIMWPTLRRMVSHHLDNLLETK
jgi:hypothetical protein